MPPSPSPLAASRLAAASSASSPGPGRRRPARAPSHPRPRVAPGVVASAAPESEAPPARGEEDATAEGRPRWVVRAAAPCDLAAVLDAARHSGVDWSDAQVEEEVLRGRVLIARKPEHAAPETAADAKPPGDGKDAPGVVSGLACAWVVAGAEVQILEVAVRPESRREGLGTALVRAALDLDASLDATLEARAGNVAALALYESVGFERVGRRDAYYADGEDAVLMRRAAPMVSARELTRLLAGLTPEEARRRPPPTPEEKQRGDAMHPQDFPRDRPAFVRASADASGAARGKEAQGEGGSEVGRRMTPGGFRMRNRIRGRG